MTTILPAILEDEAKTWRLEFDFPNAHTGRVSTDLGGTPFLWIPATVRLEDQTHDICATVYERLGIPTSTIIRDRQNRPLPLLSEGEPLRAILG